jgi:ankyrin repeat protein
VSYIATKYSLLREFMILVRVRLLLEKGLTVNAAANSGGTALMFAAGAGHFEVVQALLAAGADPNAVVAATSEYIEQVVAAVAEGKTDVETHKDGITALMLAAESGHLEIAQLLVEQGAIVDVADDEDLTPLLNAVKGGHEDIARYLLKHGANPNHQFTDAAGKTHILLLDAVINKNIDYALELLEAGANASCTDEQQVSALTEASYLGLTDVVAALLRAGADASVSSTEGITALIAAASEGHTEIVTLLLQSPSTNVNSRDKDGTNALMAACVRGHLETVKQLIAHGANLNAQNNDGHTALMFAYNGKNQIQSLQAKYHEYVTEDDATNLALLESAIAVHTDVISTLLSAGADSNLKV